MPFCTECGGEHSGISSSCKRCGAELSSTVDLKPAVSRVSTNNEAPTATSRIWSLPLLKPERGEWNIPLGVVYFIGLPILLLLLFDTFIALPDTLDLAIGVVGFFLILLSVAFLGLSVILPPLIVMSQRVQKEWNQLTESEGREEESKMRTAIVAGTVLFSLFIICGIVGSGAILASSLGESPEVSEAALNSEEIRAGDSVGVDGVVRNDADESKSTTIELTANGEVIDSQEIELDPGESREIRFDVRFESPGEYDIELLGETVGTLVVEHNIEITDATLAKQEIGNGSYAEVTVLGTNVGNTTESRTIELTANGAVIESEEVTLDPGEEREIRLTSRFDDEGEYDIQVNGEFVGSLSVVPLRPAEFKIDEFSLSEKEVERGDTVEITTVVRNTGGQSGDLDVELKADGSLVDSKEVSLSSGEERPIKFSYSASEIGETDLEINDELVGTLSVFPNATDDDAFTNYIRNLVSNEGIDVHSTQVSNGRDQGGEKTVIISYQTSSTSFVEISGSEMGAFTGSFVEAVRRGWDIDSMAVVVGDQQGTAIGVYVIEEKWVKQYINDEITDEELRSRIINTWVPY